MKRLSRHMEPVPLQTGSVVAHGVVDAAPAEESDAGFLLEYWHVLWKRRWHILAAGVIAALAGVGLSVLQTPVYSSSATVQINGFNEGFLGLEGVSPTATAPATTNVYLPTQIRILESDSLIADTAAALELSSRPDFQSGGGLRRALALIGLAPDVELPAEEVALRKARRSLSVEPMVQTQLVQIAFRSSDPELAAKFPNVLVQRFIRKNMELRREAGRATSGWLDEELAEQKRLLEEAETRMSDYARRHGLFFTGAAQESIAEDKMRQLQLALLTAEADAAAAQSRFERAVAAPADSLGETLDDATLRQTQTSLTALRRELAETELWFKPSYPRIRELQAQIDELEAAVNRDRANIVQRIENDYRTLRRRADLLGEEFGRQTRLVSNESGQSIQYNILKREVESNRQVYDSLLVRMKEAGVAAAIQSSNISVVDAARIPLEPASPNVPRNALIALMLGLFGAVGWVFLKDRTDYTVRTPGEATARLQLRELGVIPSLRADPEAGGRTLSGMATDGSPVELVSWRQDRSALAEAFQTTLTSIENRAADDGRSRTIVVSSARPLEGKTTVVTNLAVSLARRGRRVLVIDGDLRRPRLHELLDLPNELGVSNILHRGRHDQGVDAQAVVRPTAVPNLYLLPAGSELKDVTRLLSSPRAGELMTRLEDQFDMILIDTPPALSFTDARLWVRLADSVVIVLRAGETSREAALAAQQRFQDDGADILGVVLNDFKPDRDRSPWFDPRDSQRYYAAAPSSGTGAA